MVKSYSRSYSKPKSAINTLDLVSQEMIFNFSEPQTIDLPKSIRNTTTPAFFPCRKIYISKLIDPLDPEKDWTLICFAPEDPSDTLNRINYISRAVSYNTLEEFLKMNSLC